MIYREYGKTGVMLSVIGLGGHEFYSDGKIKGFGDDYKLAVKPGYIFPNFGGADREELVKAALDNGINLFDVTIDSEKEAMGRILNKLKPSFEVYIQTRPEGMVYTYDQDNRQMADYDLLKNEAVRILKLLKRETIDFFNLAFMQSALDADSEYLEKIGYNVGRLKKEGLIRFSNADTFSGEMTYLKQIETKYFDSIFINVNILNDFINNKVLPAANNQSMGVFCRELFKKGLIFKLAKIANIEDNNKIARANIKWALSQNVTSAIIGVANKEQLKSNVEIVNDLEMNNEDVEIINKIKELEEFKKIYKEQKELFVK